MMSLEAGLTALHCTMSEAQIKQLQHYVELLMRWNKVYNLTAITEKDDILRLHILDSLAVAPYIKGTRFLDVGSGGGLPGIPLAILYPEKHFTLMDKVGKKTRFMQQAAIELKLPNVSVEQARVESWTPEHRFDAIISRAFSSMTDFVILTGKHLHKQGSFYAMKGRYPADEIAALPNEYRVVTEQKLEIPQLDSERYLIEIKNNQA